MTYHVMQSNVVYESVEARDEKFMINVNHYAAVASREDELRETSDIYAIMMEAIKPQLYYYMLIISSACL